MPINARVNVAGLAKLKAKLLDNPPMMREIADAWALLYRSFIRRRYDAASKGDGTWPALNPKTIARRRGRGRNVAILRDTNAMFAATQPTLGAAGLINSSYRPLGFEAFLGGSPISELAAIHDAGNSRLPQRQILVVPPQNEIDKMQKIGVQIATKEANK